MTGAQDFEKLLQTPTRGGLPKQFKRWIEEQCALRGITASLQLGEKMYLLRHNLISAPLCQGCGAPVKFQKSVMQYMRFCSRKCSANAVSTQQCKRSTNQAKYGTINAANASKDERSKRNFERRFVEFESFVGKVVPLFGPNDWKGGLSVTQYPWKCVRCETHFESVLKAGFPPCPKCEKSYSDVELFIKKFLDENSIVYQPHNRAIIGDHKMEIDFYLPEQNVGIEVHGLWFHSDKFFPKNYHQTKAQVCQSKDIRLIQIFSDEIFGKPDIVKSKLTSILGIRRCVKFIGARSCKIAPINKTLVVPFLKANHIQGGDRAQIHYGAYYNDLLVGVMTFCRPRIALGYKNTADFWELSRFCTLSGYQMAGLFSKMLKKFKADNPSVIRIVSYADNRWTCPKNNVYTKAGFAYISTSKPSYFYCKKGESKSVKRLHRFGFRKDLLVRKYPELSHLTETAIMEHLGYWKVWDAGQHKFELVL